MLTTIDYFLTLLHILLILFNLFGWIIPSLRKLHFISICITAFSWLFLGIWFGIGYCPITDLQWHIKKMLGETHLPSSYITYLVQAISGRRFADDFINNVTATFFIIATLLSVYFNFIKPRLNR